MSSVIIAEYLGMLKKLAAGDALLELGARNKVITCSGALMAARRTGGVGDGEFQVRDALEEPVDQSGFTRPGWRRDDKYGVQRFTPGSRIARGSCRFQPWRPAPIP